MIEDFRQYRAEGLQVTRAIQLSAREAHVFTDGAEVECTGENGRNQEPGDQDGELLP